MRNLTAVIVITLCSSCTSSHQDRRAATVPPVPAFSIIIAEGGGFTGMWDGLELDTTGVVTKLSGRPLGANRSPVGHLSRDDISTLRSAIQASHILTSPPDSKKGNMMRILFLTLDQDTVNVSWLVPVGERTALDSLYSKIHTLLEHAGARK